MRDRVETIRSPSLHTTVLVTALFAILTVGAAGCSSQTSKPTPTTARAEPSSRPVSSITPAPAPAPTPKRVSAPSRARAVAPSHRPPPIARAAALARSLPVRLKIPSIGVDSALLKLGLRPDGSMQVPPGGFPAGWYNGGPTPGELGPAVVVGHVDMGGPGVFYKLHTVKPGELVAFTREDGSTPVFRVTQVQQFRKSKFPTERIFGDLPYAGLRLITCGGTFNSKTGHYEDNLVVFAELVTQQR